MKILRLVRTFPVLVKAYFDCFPTMHQKVNMNIFGWEYSWSCYIHSNGTEKIYDFSFCYKGRFAFVLWTASSYIPTPLCVLMVYFTVSRYNNMKLVTSILYLRVKCTALLLTATLQMLCSKNLTTIFAQWTCSGTTFPRHIFFHAPNPLLLINFTSSSIYHSC